MSIWDFLILKLKQPGIIVAGFDHTHPVSNCGLVGDNLKLSCFSPGHMIRQQSSAMGRKQLPILILVSMTMS